MLRRGQRLLFNDCGNLLDHNNLRSILKSKIFSEVRITGGLKTTPDCQYFQSLQRSGATITAWQADPSDMSSLRRHLKGCDAFIMNAPFDDPAKTIDYCSNWLQAAKQEQVRNVAVISILNAEKSDLGSIYHNIESLTASFAFPGWCSLRMSFPMDSIEWLLPSMKRDGVLKFPSGTGKSSMISMHDYGNAITRVLGSEVMSQEFNGQVLSLTGPEQLDGASIAHHCSELTGKRVTFQPLSSDEFIEHLKHLDELAPAERENIGYAFQALCDGKFEGTTETLRHVLDRDPETLTNYLKRTLK